MKETNMADARSKHPADQAKYLIALINEEHEKLQECWANLRHYGDLLTRLGADNERRLLTRD